jgi:hypothetical protein
MRSGFENLGGFCLLARPPAGRYVLCEFIVTGASYKLAPVEGSSSGSDINYRRIPFSEFMAATISIRNNMI